MAAVMQHTAHISRTIPAPVELVFKAWTDRDLLARWFAPGDMTVTVHEQEAKVGGQYRVEMHGETSYTAFGEYLEIVQDRRIVMSWQWKDPFDGVGDAAGSILTVEFDAVDGGTEVRLTHDRLEHANSVEEHSKGWMGVLENLATRIEGF